MIISCGLLIIQNKGSFLFKENLAFLLKDTVIMPIVFSVGSLPCHLSGNNRAKLISTFVIKCINFLPLVLFSQGIIISSDFTKTSPKTLWLNRLQYIYVKR